MNFGTCPVCNGTGRKAAGEDRYKTMYAGYDKETDTLPCTNCGGQTMFGRPTGKVPLRDDGTPCVHKYSSRNVGRCLTEYTCQFCGSRHEIDSGD